MTGLEHTFIATAMLACAYYAGRHYGIKQGRIEGVSKTFELMSDEEIGRITAEISEIMEEENDG